MVFIVTQMSLDNIMSNIYGEASSQHFDKVSLLKTQFKLSKRSGAIKYLDNEPVRARSQYIPPGNQSFNLSGGSKRNAYSGGASKQIEESASVETIGDSAVTNFVNTFHLNKLLLNAHPNTVLVVPSGSQLKKYEEEFTEACVKGGVKNTSSPEAAKIAAKDDSLTYKNCIFDVYGRDSSDNAGFPYKIPVDFMNGSSSEVFRRTNRFDNVYYFKVDGGELTVSANKSMSGSKPLTLVGRFPPSCLVFKGDLPSAESKVKGSNVATASLSGGAKRLSLRNYFNQLVAKHDNDIHAAAEEFVPSVMLAEVSRTGNISRAAEKVANYCSADIVHSAMSILFSDADQEGFGEASIDEVEGFSASDMDAANKAILDHYTPKGKSIAPSTAMQAIKSLYAKSASAGSPMEASRSFVSDIVRMYGKYPISMFKADVATSILSSHRVNDSTMSHIYSLADSINDLANRTNYSGQSNNPLFKEQVSTHAGVTSALTNAIYNAFTFRPFIGINAKCGTPMFMKHNHHKSIMSSYNGVGTGARNACKKKSKCSGKKKGCGKHAFEDQNAIDLDNVDYGFNLIEREEVPEIKQPTAEPDDLSDEDSGDDELRKNGSDEDDSDKEEQGNKASPDEEFAAFLED